MSQEGNPLLLLVLCCLTDQRLQYRNVVRPLLEMLFGYIVGFDAHPHSEALMVNSIC